MTLFEPSGKTKHKSWSAGARIHSRRDLYEIDNWPGGNCVYHLMTMALGNAVLHVPGYTVSVWCEWEAGIDPAHPEDITNCFDEEAEDCIVGGAVSHSHVRWYTTIYKDGEINPIVFQQLIADHEMPYYWCESLLRNSDKWTSYCDVSISTQGYFQLQAYDESYSPNPGDDCSGDCPEHWCPYEGKTQCHSGANQIRLTGRPTGDMTLYIGCSVVTTPDNSLGSSQTTSYTYTDTVINTLGWGDEHTSMYAGHLNSDLVLHSGEIWPAFTNFHVSYGHGQPPAFTGGTHTKTFDEGGEYERTYRWVFSDDTISFYSGGPVAGLAGLPITIAVKSGPQSVTFDANGYWVDGGLRDGVRWVVPSLFRWAYGNIADPADPPYYAWYITNNEYGGESWVGNGQHALEWLGWWQIACPNYIWPEIPNYCHGIHDDLGQLGGEGIEVYDVPATPGNWIDYRVKVHNIVELGEPWYVGDDAWGDDHVPLGINTWTWDAWELKHNDNISLKSFNSTDEWTGTNCSIGLTGVPAHIEVYDVSADAQAVADYSESELWLGHYRFADVYWSSSDGSSMRLWIGNKYWDLAQPNIEGYTRIDLCRPHNAFSSGGVSDQQSFLDKYYPKSVAPKIGAESTADTWLCNVTVMSNRSIHNDDHWGVDKVEEIRLTNLTAGATYELQSIKGRIVYYSRLYAVNQWGFRKDRDDDFISKIRSGVKVAANGEDEVFSDEIWGVVITDGKITLEISCHLWDEWPSTSLNYCCLGGGVNPYIRQLPDVSWPDEPAAAFTWTELAPDPYVGSTPPDPTPYYLHNGRLARHLKRIHGSDIADTGVIDCKIRPDKVLYQASGELPYTLEASKFFGGLVHGLVFDGNDPAGGREVTIECDEVASVVHTDGAGHFISGRMPYTVDEDDATVTLSDATPPVVVGGVAVRQRRITTMGAVGVFPSGSAGGGDILGDWLTGILQKAYVNDSGALVASRSFDCGISWEIRKEVSAATNSPENPCVLLDTNSDQRNWGVAWNEGTTVKIAWSQDGFATKEVSTLLALEGLTNVRAIVHPLTGVMMAAGWRDSDESIVAARSLDHGVTWSALVVVVAVPEQAFGLTVAPSDRNTWIVECRDALGIGQTYWSTDNGLTWGLAA